MIEILMAFFGGGYMDWNELCQTKYDWDNIVRDLKSRFGSNIEVNDFYVAVLEEGAKEFIDLIDNFIKENKSSEDEEVQKIIKIFKNCDYNNIEDERIWYIYANCLNTSIKFYGIENEEDKQLVQDYFSKEIEQINDNIGFTYIDFE